MESYAGTSSRATVERRRRARLGGTAGNEALTIAAAILLTLWPMAEGITPLAMGSLLSVHMILGLVLVRPVLLNTRQHRLSIGPLLHATPAPMWTKARPPWPCASSLPVLVLTTVGIFVTGVLLLALGHKSDQLVFLHKVLVLRLGRGVRHPLPLAPPSPAPLAARLSARRSHPARPRLGVARHAGHRLAGRGRRARHLPGERDLRPARRPFGLSPAWSRPAGCCGSGGKRLSGS